MYDDTTWYQKPGKHILCTESPLVRQYISETVKGIFQALPGLSGIGVIIGGEEFHHCFMRPYAVEKGHTTCPRCEALGHDTVVANLCNYMADAARQINPAAEVFAWPYSAAHVWSIGDPAQLGFIRKLKPGVALFTDIVKDDTVSKPEGVNKLLWDYSIDLPGPGKLAQQQLKACHDQGIPIHFKSEPELAFEASRLPGLPCHGSLGEARRGDDLQQRRRRLGIPLVCSVFRREHGRSVQLLLVAARAGPGGIPAAVRRPHRRPKGRSASQKSLAVMPPKPWTILPKSALTLPASITWARLTRCAPTRPPCYPMNSR